MAARYRFIAESRVLIGGREPGALGQGREPALHLGLETRPAKVEEATGPM